MLWYSEHIFNPTLVSPNYIFLSHPAISTNPTKFRDYLSVYEHFNVQRRTYFLVVLEKWLPEYRRDVHIALRLHTCQAFQYTTV